MIAKSGKIIAIDSVNSNGTLSGYGTPDSPLGVVVSAVEKKYNAGPGLELDQHTDTFKISASYVESITSVSGKVDKPTATQTGKLVYDATNKKWVPAPEQVEVSANNGLSASYNASRNTYNIGLRKTEKDAIDKIDDIIEVVNDLSRSADVWDTVTEKVDKSAFNSYKTSAANELDKKLNTTDFNTWSATAFDDYYVKSATDSLLDKKLDTLAFDAYKTSAAAELDKKLDTSDFNTWSATAFDDYYVKSATDSMLDKKLDTEAFDEWSASLVIDNYSAGNGIKIEDNIISVSADYAMSADVYSREDIDEILLDYYTIDDIDHTIDDISATIDDKFALKSDMSAYALSADVEADLMAIADWTMDNFQKSGHYVTSAGPEWADKMLVLKNNQWEEIQKDIEYSAGPGIELHPPVSGFGEIENTDHVFYEECSGSISGALMTVYAGHDRYCRFEVPSTISALHIVVGDTDDWSTVAKTQFEFTLPEDTILEDVCVLDENEDECLMMAPMSWPGLVTYQGTVTNKIATIIGYSPIFYNGQWLSTDQGQMLSTDTGKKLKFQI